jgi:hypothetical protein
MLLGLVREGEGVSARILVDKAAELSRVRKRVIETLSGIEASSPAASPTAGTAERRSRLLGDVTALLGETERLEREVERLRARLREHGIEPDGGETRSA